MHLVGSEVPWELALFTAVEGGMVEEGAGCAVPLRPLILLLVCNGLHNLTARVWGKEKEKERVSEGQKDSACLSMRTSNCLCGSAEVSTAHTL